MKIKAVLIFIVFSQFANAQTKITIPRYIQMPKDTIVKKQIITDLNNFLIASQDENEANQYILPTQKVETFILADEFRGVEKSRGNKHFFKPFLNNVVKIDSNKYLIQLSNIGVYDSIPYLRSNFNLIAYEKDNSFLFSSPLIENTKYWKSKTIKNFTFYFKNHLNVKKAKEYVKLANIFDKKLKSTGRTTKIYCTNNTPELLKIIGVDYKLDYNGRKSGGFSAIDGKEQLLVSGNGESFDDFDPHDLWHDRLSLVISRNKVNKHVDEACAYLYGGSWGLTWDEIFKKFMKKVVAGNKDVDWTFYKENKSNFAETQAEHLMVDYVITALLVQKIEKEKGFEGVWKLLNCGKYEKGNENFYSMLNELIGINKENYNIEVDKLIRKENENLKQ